MKHIVAIIDRSGSMEIIKDDMNGGIKEWFESFKDSEDTVLTSVLFDTEYLVTNTRQNVQDVDVSSLMIEPRGSTALNDAMLKGLATIQADEDALVFVVTDGFENASHEATKEMVKSRVEDLTAQGVEFVYLSANVDAISDSASYGIAAANTVAYAANTSGTKVVSSNLRSSTEAYLNNTSKTA